MKRFLSFALLLATATAASAHAFLEHSNVGAGTKVRAAPKTLTLDFGEPLEPVFSNVTVSDAQGHNVAAAESVASGAQMRVLLPVLKPGTYRVVWRALSVDAHRTEGTFTFTVAP